MSVLVAIPAYGGLVHVGCVRSVLSIADAFGAAGVEVDFLVAHGESAITRGRSNLVTTFLRTSYRTLAFLDADIEIAGEDMLELYRLDKPVRGAAVALKTLDGREALSVYRDGARLSRAEMPAAPFEVDYLGGSVLLVERDVLLELSRLHLAALGYDDAVAGPGVHLFAERVEDRMLLSEDYAFCARAYEAGYSIWCAPSVLVTHHDGRVGWRS